MGSISSYPNQANLWTGARFNHTHSGTTYSSTLDVLYRSFKTRDLSNRDISGDFRVSGDFLTTGRLTVSGFTSLAHSQITGNVNLRGNLLISGHQTNTGDITVHRNLTVGNNIVSSGSINCSGTLVALSGVDFARTLNVTGKGTFGHDFSSYGYTELAISGRPTIIYGTNQVRSNETIWGTETIGGTTTISGALRTSGVVTIDNTVNIYNATYLRGDVQIGGNTAMSGSLTTSGNFFVSGNSQLGDNVSDLTNIAGDLICRGYGSITGGLSTANILRVSGNSVVTGSSNSYNLTLGNELKVSGSSYFGSLHTNSVLVTGSLSTTRDVTSNGSLYVRQTGTISGHLILSGHITSPSIKYVSFDGVAKNSSVHNLVVSGGTVHFGVSTGTRIATGDTIQVINVAKVSGPLTDAQKALHSGRFVVGLTGLGTISYTGSVGVTGVASATIDFVMRARQGVSGIERPSATASDYRIVFDTPFANSNYVTEITTAWPISPFIHYDDPRSPAHKRILLNRINVGFEDCSEVNVRCEGIVNVN